MGAANSIEQRWSQRRPLAVTVEVFDHGNLVATCVSKDISLGGVFLSLDAPLLRNDQCVDLFFNLGKENPTRHKLKAKVVHAIDGGTGLMFKDFDTSAFRSLQEIMRRPPTPA